jgi:Tol biopolymer transport system component
LTSPFDRESDPAWSPDGDLIAYIRNDGTYGHIFVTDPEHGTERRLSKSKFRGTPAWSPNGKQIAVVGLGSAAVPRSDPYFEVFARNRIYIVRADGQGAHAVTGDIDVVRDVAFSPDGNRIAFIRGELARGILVVMAPGGKAARKISRAEQFSWRPVPAG